MAEERLINTAKVRKVLGGIMDELPDPSLPNERRRILAELLTRTPNVETPSGTNAFKAAFKHEYDKLLEKRRKAEGKPVGSKRGSRSKKKKRAASKKKTSRTIKVRGRAVELEESGRAASKKRATTG